MNKEFDPGNTSNRNDRHRAPTSESEIVEWLVSDLSAFGESVAWRTEVRSHGRARTDVCVVAEDVLIGIEVKRTDWRRAISQAVLNRFCVDRSYVAFWNERVSDEAVSEAQRWGIGVLGVSRDTVQLREPASLGRPDPTVRARMLDEVAGYRSQTEAGRLKGYA